MTKVSRVEFRRALCSGVMAGCEVVHGTNGCAWMRDGKWVGSMLPRLFFGMNYYLGE